MFEDFEVVIRTAISDTFKTETVRSKIEKAIEKLPQSFYDKFIKEVTKSVLDYFTQDSDLPYDVAEALVPTIHDFLRKKLLG